MRVSLTELLRMGVARLPAAVFSPEARAGLARIDRQTPRVFSFGAFEWRLEEYGGECDFSACIEGEDAQAVVGARRQVWPWPVAALERWGVQTSRLGSSARDAWIEFDLQGRADRPAAFLYFAPSATAGSDGEAAVRAIVEEAFGGTGDGLERRALDVACQCVRALPRNACTMLVASLGHRQRDRLRLSVGLAPEDVPGYLSRLGWGGVDVASRMLSDVMANEWRVVPLQVDIQPSGIGERVSVEFYSPSLSEGEARWERLLGCLTKEGLCHPLWLAQLWAWPRLPASAVSTRCELDLKISLTSSGRKRAKAYLGFRPQMRLLR